MRNVGKNVKYMSFFCKKKCQAFGKNPYTEWQNGQRFKNQAKILLGVSSSKNLEEQEKQREILSLSQFFFSHQVSLICY